jgi:hypothetical protein
MAFIYAGSRALLVSRWQVDSVTAVKLTIGMIPELAGAVGSNWSNIRTDVVTKAAAHRCRRHGRIAQGLDRLSQLFALRRQPVLCLRLMIGCR